MKILGIDYGIKKVGLALADGLISQPLRVIRYQRIKILGEQIKRIIEQEKIEKVVVGISEGKMADETNKFLSAIRSTLSPVPCEVYDETLSTHEAQKFSREAGVKRIKRKKMEDAYAATIMLQNYLDNNLSIDKR